jgi:hypothetical protein
VTYTVTATNAYGSGQGSKTVNWGTAPPVGTDFCASNAIRGRLPWRGDLATSGFGEEDFAGELVAQTGGLTRIGAVEFRGGVLPRVMTISTSPCDFRGINWGVSWTIDASTPNVPGDYPIALSHGTDPAFEVTLTPGVKYYVNIRNVRFADGAPTCSSTSCDMLITVKD